MKSNFNIVILVLILSSTTFARPKVSNTSSGGGKVLGFGKAPSSKMTKPAKDEFEDFREYAREVRDSVYDDVKNSSTGTYEERLKAAAKASKGLTSNMAVDDNLTVLNPKMISADGRNTAWLEQMQIDSSGNMSKSGFEILSTHEQPTSISLTQRYNGGGGGVNEIVAVKRTFDMPNSADGELIMKNEMLAKELRDGNVYAMTLRTEVTTGDNVVEASIVKNYIDTREISVSFTTKNPNDYINDLYYASGNFKLPDEIKGEVVSVNINSTGTRLTFRTTEGIEYRYSVQKDPSKKTSPYDSLTFSQISKTEVPGGKKSLLAKVKIYKGKTIRARTDAKEPVRGMEVDSAEAVR